MDQDNTNYQRLHPGSDGMLLGRSADLERHIQKLHSPGTPTGMCGCDYKRCRRHSSTVPSSEGSTSRDHYRDHLRDFHKEDIL